MTHFDLVIIGTGSGNSLITPEMDGWRIAVVERGVFGGTCINRGCVPSKMFVYPADLAARARESAHLGITTRFEAADWPAIVRRIFGRIDPISVDGLRYRHSNHNVTMFEDEARFVDQRALRIGGETVTADHIVLAAGARPFVPPVHGLDRVPFHTSDTIMRIPRLPRHLVILGGGFIAAEMGHVFASFGTKVTVVNRSPRMLMHEDADISAAYTAAAGQRFDLRLGVHADRVEQTAAGFAVHYTSRRGPGSVEADELLLATGRVPNGDQLDAESGGIELGPGGEVLVDAYGRTTAEGVWALGDLNGRYQLKHMANGEAKVIRHNLLHPDDLRPLDSRPAPHAVFGHPQIGAVGLTEAQAAEAGHDVRVIRQPYGSAAYGWAMEDTESFVKLIGDPASRRLVGAHAIGHESSLLIQLLVQGMHLGNTVDEMAAQIWIHPALSEVVEQALLALISAFGPLT